MKNARLSRRGVLTGTGALLAGAAFSTRVVAAAPPPEPVTPALIEAARKEGQVIHYTSTDLPVAEKLAKAFEAKYPGIAVRVERTGAERVFQRIGQEYASNIRAVDVVNSSDAAHFILWKRDGILAPYVPEDVAKFYSAEHKDVDGQFASWRIWLSIIAYNTNLVKPDEAPKSFADSIRNGRARSSRRIPATAAPS
jgi:iron(III) transport system substrate-binding protein